MQNQAWELRRKCRRVDEASLQLNGELRVADLPLPPDQLRALGLLPQPSIWGLSASWASAANDRSAPLGAALPPGEASARQLALRRDAPAIRYTTGASRLCLDLSNDEAREDLFNELEADVSAKSSVSSLASLERTWTRLHREWFGSASQPFPTWPAALRAVAAQMERLKYRSFNNYLSRAKRLHIRAGAVWDQTLEAVGSECTKSVLRGIGPPRQSAELDLDKVSALPTSSDALTPGSLCRPVDSVIVGSFFLVRELELALAVWRNFQVSDAVVKWCLPASKADPTAAAVTREWKCLCGDTPRPCPVHAALRIKQFRLQRDGAIDPDSPVFIVPDGRVPTKDEVVNTIEALGRLTGDKLIDELGRRRFGGHSMRVSGARYLANLGLEMFKLAVLARWNSPVLLRYVADAPLKVISDDCRRLLAGAKLDAVIAEMAKQNGKGARTPTFRTPSTSSWCGSARVRPGRPCLG